MPLPPKTCMDRGGSLPCSKLYLRAPANPRKASFLINISNLEESIFYPLIFYYIGRLPQGQ